MHSNSKPNNTDKELIKTSKESIDTITENLVSIIIHVCLLFLLQKKGFHVAFF